MKNVRVNFFKFVGVLFLGIQPAFANINAFPSSVNFGEIEVGSSSFRETIVVRNNSDRSQNLSVSHSCFADFDVSDFGCFSLGPYGSCQISITYRPQREGYHSCMISIYPSGSYSQSVYASGRARNR